MLYLANLFVSKIRIGRIDLVYLALGLALLLNFLLPADLFLNLEFWTRSILASLLVALPIFLASIIFSHYFKAVEQDSIGTMYGINLAGAVLGGFLEYGSMISGLNFLYILAGIIYLAAFISSRKVPESA